MKRCGASESNNKSEPIKGRQRRPSAGGLGVCAGHVDYAHCDPKVTEIVSASCYF